MKYTERKYIDNIEGILRKIVQKNDIRTLEDIHYKIIWRIIRSAIERKDFEKYEKCIGNTTRILVDTEQNEARAKLEKLHGEAIYDLFRDIPIVEEYNLDENFDKYAKAAIESLTWIVEYALSRESIEMCKFALNVLGIKYTEYPDNEAHGDFVKEEIALMLIQIVARINYKIDKGDIEDNQLADKLLSEITHAIDRRTNCLTLGKALQLVNDKEDDWVFKIERSFWDRSFFPRGLRSAQNTEYYLLAIGTLLDRKLLTRRLEKGKYGSLLRGYNQERMQRIIDNLLKPAERENALSQINCMVHRMQKIQDEDTQDRSIKSTIDIEAIRDEVIEEVEEIVQTNKDIGFLKEIDDADNIFKFESSRYVPKSMFQKDVTGFYYKGYGRTIASIAVIDVLKRLARYYGENSDVDVIDKLDDSLKESTGLVVCTQDKYNRVRKYLPRCTVLIEDGEDRLEAYLIDEQ
ncbi:MAG: hypothetical protein KAS73_12010, partial [Candidatus Sabulitectum sp.]|nr:hypothetical protein [Candidatus Sabulitectum sp.]